MKRLLVLLLVLMGMPLISFSQEQVDTTAAEQAGWTPLIKEGNGFYKECFGFQD